MFSSINEIKYLKGVGEKRAELLKKLGIGSVDALLSFYPKQYKNLSDITKLSDASLNETYCIRGKIVTPVSENRIRKNMVIYKFVVKCDDENLRVTLFNTGYFAKQLRMGAEYLFYGKITGGVFAKEMTSPEIYPSNCNVILPVYRQTEGLTSKVLQKLIKAAMDTADFTDYMPSELCEFYNLCTLEYAIKNIHFPVGIQSLERAKKRLVFDELFLMQTGIRYFGNIRRTFTSVRISKDYSEEFYKLLKFNPTASQKQAVKEAMADMCTEVPMNRLLQGDVGSGKTLVAAALIYNTVKNGYQAILMAPTQILAEQHYKTLSELFKNSGINCRLLTSGTTAKQKKQILAEAASGKADVIIGTHAVIFADFNFKNIGLVITDEQHRFGVNQRSALSALGKAPHTLVMSATPIPRTLALTVYGDLSISTINEYPKGRTPIESYAVGCDLRERAYNYVKKHIDSGRQAYIVCPLVTENESEHISAEQLYKNLTSGTFKNYRVGLLHGKMSNTEKEKIMREFSSGNIDLLVSTTVIEVGIDVPNAAIMVIENADLFGLSQLHQLRGRVGRGQYKGTCIFISSDNNPKNNARLNIICKTRDGFKIAEEDLKLRGPGDFLGSRQHGLPEFKIADIFADTELLKAAQTAAENLLNKDSRLENYPELRIRIQELFKDVNAN